MRRRWRIILAIVVVGVSVVGAGAYLAWPGGGGLAGVETVVRNSSPAPMRDVRVVVTGGSYRIGDIPPGESRSVRVKPSGDSSVRLEYTDAGGARSVDLDCYIEAGYSGGISVDVANGAVVRKSEAIRPGPY